MCVSFLKGKEIIYNHFYEDLLSPETDPLFIHFLLFLLGQLLFAEINIKKKNSSKSNK